jgi:hypothetical protein
MDGQRRTPGVWWLRAGLLVLLLLACGVLAHPARAGVVNLVQNGNFTSTSVTGDGGYLCVNSGSSCSSQLSNWSATCSSGGCSGNLSPSSILVAGTDGDAFNPAYSHPGLYWTGSITPPSGGNVVAIDGDPSYTSKLTQSISGLTVGKSYTLTFYQASSQEISFTGQTTEKWQVSLGGGTAQTSALMTTASQGSTGWTEQTMTFVSNALSETLQFVAVGTPNGEPPVVLLGGVSLVQKVSEPVSAALLGVGLVAVVMVRRRMAAG